MKNNNIYMNDQDYSDNIDYNNNTVTKCIQQ